MQVEFIEPDEPDVPDDVVGRHRPRGRWRRVALILAFAAAAAVVVVRHDSGTQTALPAPLSTAAPIAPLPAPGLGLSYRTWTRVSLQHCPGKGTCTAYPSMPAVALAAVRDVFPNAQLGQTVTTTADGSLWYRQVNVRAGEFALVVRIDRPRSFAAETRPGIVDRMKASAFVRRNVAAYVVEVQVIGPVRVALPLDAASTLAADKRLLLIG